MNKYLFLDIDGVLVTNFKKRVSYNLPEGETTFYTMEKRCIDCLNEIVQNTNCDIVISSSWRGVFSLESFQSIFKENGFLYPEKIIDYTINSIFFLTEEPLPIVVPRGIEIYLWLHKNVRGKVSEFYYCIIDDNSDMLYEQKDHFVQTIFKKGLTKQHVKKVIKIYDKISY